MSALANIMQAQERWRANRPQYQGTLADLVGDRLFTASQVSRGKPAPDLFLHAAAEFHDRAHPIHRQAAAHKRALLEYFRRALQALGATDADALAAVSGARLPQALTSPYLFEAPLAPHVPH